MFAALASLVAAQLGCNVCHRSMEEARDASLLQNLFTLRYVVELYTVDQHKRPQSLVELVTSGYLKEVPADPMTRRRDSWAVEWSGDPKTPGIVNVHSPSRSISSKGTAYCDW
jgi:general secretion pathway protein G